MSENEFDFGAEFESFGDDLKGVSFEGDYRMVAQKVVPGQTAKGKQQFLVTLAFTDGPFKAKGKTVLNRLIWSPESDVAARIFAQSLRVLGAPQEWIMAEHPTPAQIAERITGSVVDVRLRPSEFNGQPTTDVTYRSNVSVGNQAAAAPASQVAAVSLDDEDEPEVDTTTGEVLETVPAGAGAPASDNPWG